MNKKQKKMLVRIIVSAAMMIILKFTPVEGILRFLLYLIPYFVIGYDVLKKAGKGILNRQVFDENFLMAVATIGAMAVALYNGSESAAALGLAGESDYTEAIAVMLFYQIGELFQSYAVGKSRRNISELMDIRPDYANIETDGELTQVDPDEVKIGTVIVVKPGEKVPIDGIIVEGVTSLNTSALTGESLPREAKAGDEVISGCINMNGLIKIRTTKEFGESTVSKILDLVENASSKKSRSENFISKFARYYTPAVCYGALALAILPPVVRFFMGITPMWPVYIYRALTFLVISCPCALVISIPLSFFAGIGGASNQGVLVKGSSYLEALSEAKYVVFDKTGTMTQGVFEVNGVYENTIPKEELIELAACAESYSTHPISKSLQKAYGKDIDKDRISDVQEISGHGVIACVDGKSVVKKTVMLTGDSKAVADSVARELGVDEVFSELLPSDKVTKVEELLEKKSKKEKLAFVGDGINDAPVLSRADIGIAMGALGSDAAIEAADIVLMDDDPLKISKAVKISRKCLRIVYQNIVFAIGIKLICLLLGAIGIANMWFAIFADVGVMIIAVLNAIRALFVKKL